MFTNHVDKILPFFDHLPPFVDIFYGTNVDNVLTTYLPCFLNVLCELPLTSHNKVSRKNLPGLSLVTHSNPFVSYFTALFVTLSMVAFRPLTWKKKERIDKDELLLSMFILATYSQLFSFKPSH